MKKMYVLSFVVLSLLSCNNNKSQQQEEASAVDSVEVDVPDTTQTSITREYSVSNREIQSIKDTNGNEVQKVHFSVVIPSEYSENDLTDIANELKAKENINRVFVEFYLKGMSTNSGNYGIAIMTPDENSTKINYVAPPKEPEKKIKKPYDGCKVYGAWQMYGAKVIAYQKGGKCYMVNYFGGTNFDEPERYIKTTYRGRTAFKNAEDPNEIYVINSDGDLDGYSYGDLASTFPLTLY